MSLGDQMNQETGNILQRLQIYPISVAVSILRFNGSKTYLPTSALLPNELGDN